MTLVVDTSAVMAIFNEEAEAAAFARFLRAASGESFMSAGSLIETYRVMSSRAGPLAADQVDRFLVHFGVQIAPVDAAHTKLAREGKEQFGKGRGAAPAVLNFGDLFAYALARAMQAPLLFKGDDFGATDIEPAWKP